MTSERRREIKHRRCRNQAVMLARVVERRAERRAGAPGPSSERAFNEAFDEFFHDCITQPRKRRR